MENWPIALALLCLVCICTGAEIQSGNSVQVIGAGSGGSGGQPPVALGQPIPPSTIKIPFNPNQLEIPVVYIPTPNPPGPSPSNNNLTGFESASSTPVIFRTTSDVNGTGSFSQWASMSYLDFRAKQTSSAIYGNLAQSKDLTFAKEASLSDTSTYRAAVLSSRDSVLFSGNSYSENNNYLNDKDILHETFNAGAINKNANFLGFLMVSTENDSVQTSEYRRVMNHDVDTRFVGTSSYDAKINDSIISQDYNGYMSLKRSLRSNLSSYNTSIEDDELPCIFCRLTTPERASSLVS